MGSGFVFAKRRSEAQEAVQPYELSSSASELAVQLDDLPGVIAFDAIPLSEPRPPANRRAIQQTWEGVVLTSPSKDGEFEARLKDLTYPRAPEEAATFSIAQISEGDRDLIVPGGVFYWFIGYEINNYGQLTPIAPIRFRRLPSWTPSQLERLKRKGEETAELFGIK